jgi:hypothetical protein
LGDAGESNECPQHLSEGGPSGLAMHVCCFFAGVAAGKKSVYRINLRNYIRILNGFSYLYLMTTTAI